MSRMYFDKGYPVGTFEIGDKVYYIRRKRHSFHIKKECPYCNKTGYIEFKGAVFQCPKCHGEKEYVEVGEMIIEDSDNIKSKECMVTKSDAREIYYTNILSGTVICKQDNGENHYFKYKSDAEKACDEWNKENGTYEKLAKYRAMQ